MRNTVASLVIPKFLSNLIRWRGAVIVAVCLAVIGAYYQFFFEWHLRRTLENYLSELHGAKVNIERLSVSLFPAKVHLSGIQLGDYAQPLRNIFEIEEVNVHIALAPLLHKKLIIENMSIDGVHFATARSYPATLPVNVDKQPVFSLMDRAATGIYSGIRNELVDNPLRHLGQLGTGLNIHNTVDLLYEKLATVQKLKKLRLQLDEIAPSWERMKSDIPSAAVLAGIKGRLTRSPASIAARNDLTPAEEELSEKIHWAHKSLNDIRKELDAIRTEANDLENSLQRDATYVRRQLGLPRTDFDDLTDLTFGPRWLGLLEQLSYWLDLSRRKMPPGSSQGEVVVTLRKDGNDTIIHYGKQGKLPTFLLKQAHISSGKLKGSTEIKINADITGLTSDPTLLSMPCTIKLQADFPEKRFRNLDLNVVIDHVQSIPKESVELVIGSFRLKDWIITDASDIQLQIASASTTLTLNGIFQADTLDLNWKMGFTDVEYGTRSRFRQVEQTLKNLLDGLYAFELDGKIVGPVSQLRFESRSGLGRRLAEGLKHEFRHQFGAIDETIRASLTDRLPSLRDTLNAKLREYQESMVPPFENALRSLQSLQAVSSASNK